MPVFRTTLPAFALSLALGLAACGGASTPDTPDTTATPQVTVSRSAGRPTAAQLTAFATAFARRYPELAADRKVISIGDDAENTCDDIRRQEFSEAALVKRVQQRFAHADVEPSAKTAAGIIVLIKKQACPALKG